MGVSDGQNSRVSKHTPRQRQPTFCWRSVESDAVTGRYYYKARFTLLNLERDSFPNYSSIEVSSRKQPFGTEHQKDFRAATEDCKNGALSEWTQWLYTAYMDDLKREVIHRKKLAYDMRRPESPVRHKIDAFIAGTSDLLA